MATVTINPNLKKNLTDAFQETVKEIDAQTRQNVESAIWAWPGATRREDGSIVGSPRNAVDLGQFKNGQQLKISGNRASIDFTAPHSIYVIFGFTSRSGRQFPGRNPVERVLEQTNNGLDILVEEVKRLS
ncbi:MAG: hypothetical protein AAF810_04930 [Cyanobacteria bacterium P01_D01_bin.36]